MDKKQHTFNITKQSPADEGFDLDEAKQAVQLRLDEDNVTEQYICICGRNLRYISILSTRYIDNPVVNVICDICKRTINNHDFIWHCEYKSYIWHPQGFDICFNCISQYDHVKVKTSILVNKIMKMQNRTTGKTDAKPFGSQKKIPPKYVELKCNESCEQNQLLLKQLWLKHSNNHEPIQFQSDYMFSTTLNDVSGCNLANCQHLKRLSDVIWRYDCFVKQSQRHIQDALLAHTIETDVEHYIPSDIQHNKTSRKSEKSSNMHTTNVQKEKKNESDFIDNEMINMLMNGIDRIEHMLDNYHTKIISQYWFRNACTCVITVDLNVQIVELIVLYHYGKVSDKDSVYWNTTFEECLQMRQIEFLNHDSDPLNKYIDQKTPQNIIKDSYQLFPAQKSSRIYNKSSATDCRVYNSNQEFPDIVKEGFLYTESVLYLKKLRKRWMVLKHKNLYSYKQERIYENPTEVIDICKYKDVQCIQDNQHAKFELICGKYKRVFLASNVNDMNQWVECIKNIIIETSKQKQKKHTISVLNDFHHVLLAHSHQFEQIYHVLVKDNRNKKCDASECLILRRNHRNRCLLSKNDEKLRELFFIEGTGYDYDICKQQLLDKIHCHFLHSFDLGYRLSHIEILNVQKMLKSVECNEEVDTVDKMVKQIAYICKQKQYNLSHTFMNTSKKFVTQVHSSKNTIKYNDGIRYFYWPYYKDKTIMTDGATWLGLKHINNANEGYTLTDWYIVSRYSDLKDEMLNNKICTISNFQWNLLLEKAVIHLGTEYAKRIVCRHMFSKKYYGIAKETPISTANFIAMMTYCNQDTLQAKFSETYRRIPNTESDKSLIERHRNFAHFGKLLRENVECFGTNITGTKCMKMRFFHG
eukprot:352804_1